MHWFLSVCLLGLSIGSCRTTTPLPSRLNKKTTAQIEDCLELVSLTKLPKDLNQLKMEKLLLDQSMLKAVGLVGVHAIAKGKPDDYYFRVCSDPLNCQVNWQLAPGPFFWLWVSYKKEFVQVKACGKNQAEAHCVDSIQQSLPQTTRSIQSIRTSSNLYAYLNLQKQAQAKAVELYTFLTNKESQEELIQSYPDFNQQLILRKLLQQISANGPSTFVNQMERGFVTTLQTIGEPESLSLARSRQQVSDECAPFVSPGSSPGSEGGGTSRRRGTQQYTDDDDDDVDYLSDDDDGGDIGSKQLGIAAMLLAAGARISAEFRSSNVDVEADKAKVDDVKVEEPKLEAQKLAIQVDDNLAKIAQIDDQIVELKKLDLNKVENQEKLLSFVQDKGLARMNIQYTLNDPKNRDDILNVLEARSSRFDYIEKYSGGLIRPIKVPESTRVVLNIHQDTFKSLSETRNYIVDLQGDGVLRKQLVEIFPESKNLQYIQDRVQKLLLARAADEVDLDTLKVIQAGFRSIPEFNDAIKVKDFEQALAKHIGGSPDLDTKAVREAFDFETRTLSSPTRGVDADGVDKLSTIKRLSSAAFILGGILFVASLKTTSVQIISQLTDELTQMYAKIALLKKTMRQVRQ